MSNNSKKGLLVIISGPSGAGKGTIYAQVLQKLPNLRKSISVTTRQPRTGEIEGVHYYFRSVDEFQKMKSNGEFLENAEVYTNFYGTPKAPVMEILNKGEDVIFEIDICGARQIKAMYPESVLIFIMPPSFEVLESRLRGRKTDSEEVILRRLAESQKELSTYSEFDYFVINDDIKDSVENVVSVINAEKCRVDRNVGLINDMLKRR